MKYLLVWLSLLLLLFLSVLLSCILSCPAHIYPNCDLHQRRGSWGIFHASKWRWCDDMSVSGQSWVWGGWGLLLLQKDFMLSVLQKTRSAELSVCFSLSPYPAHFNEKEKQEVVCWQSLLLLFYVNVRKVHPKQQQKISIYPCLIN